MSHRIEGKRVTILLPNDLRARLRQHSELTGIPIVTLIRRAVDRAIPSELAERPSLSLDPPVATAPSEGGVAPAAERPPVRRRKTPANP